MNLERYLDVSPEVKAAIEAGKPVVALESTIISHGMPDPQNVETALNVERIVRENGAVPATIAIIRGKITAVSYTHLVASVVRFMPMLSRQNTVESPTA